MKIAELFEFELGMGNRNGQTTGSRPWSIAKQPMEMFVMGISRMDGDARIQYKPAIGAVCSSR
jgi:hypothetical protein